MKRFLIAVLICLMVFSSTNAWAEWLYATDGDTHIHFEADIDSRTVGTFKKGEKIWVFEHVYTPDGRNWCGVNYLGKIAFISDRYSSYKVSNPDDYVDVNRNNEFSNNYAGYEYGDCYDNYDEDDDFIYNYNYDYNDCEEEFEFEVTHNTKAKALPDVESKSLGKIAKRTRIYSSRIYTSCDGKAWLEVQGDSEKIGYVYSGHVRLTEQLVNNHFPSLSRFMYVTGGSVNVRERASINSRSLFTIHEGDAVIVDYFVCVYDGERRIWAHSYDEDGTYLGFVSTLYLDTNVG